jgi:hypothetical protein
MRYRESALPGETESGSALKQPDKGYLGRRCAHGVIGLLRSRRHPGAAFLYPLDTRIMPWKIHLATVTRLHFR